MVKYGSIMKRISFFLGTDLYLATELTPNSSDCNPKSQIPFAAGPVGQHVVALRKFLFQGCF